MVSRTEAILNLFETKAKREVWLDRFAASNLSIDNFCELNHIKKETITKAIVEAATEPVIEKFQIIDDEPCYEKPAEMIIVKLGKAVIELPSTIGKGQLQTILKAVIEL